jgi:hypothetical protein
MVVAPQRRVHMLDNAAMAICADANSGEAWFTDASHTTLANRPGNRLLVNVITCSGEGEQEPHSQTGNKHTDHETG